MSKVINLEEKKDNPVIYKDLEYQPIDLEVKNFDDDNFEFDIVMTSGNKDITEEIVRPDGIDFKYFDKNPVVLYNHNAFSQDVQVVGRVIKRQALKNSHVARVRMAVKDWQETGFANKALLLYKLYKSRVMRAASIGFQTTERDPNDRDIITKSRLFELSLVIIPANFDAMAKAFKSGYLTSKDRSTMLDECKSLKKVLTSKQTNESMPNMTKKTTDKKTKTSDVKSLTEQLVEVTKANASLSNAVVEANKTINELRAKMAKSADDNDDDDSKTEGETKPDDTQPKSDGSTNQPAEDKELSTEDKAEIEAAKKSAYSEAFTSKINEARGKVQD